jgi:ATP-dependent DNA helicase RecQ
MECRTSIIVQYFGEKKSKDCGICDVCLRHKRSLNEDFVSQKTIEIIKSICLASPNIKEDELMKLANITDLDNYVLILRWLKDYQYINKTKEGWVQWNIKKQ